MMIADAATDEKRAMVLSASRTLGRVPSGDTTPAVAAEGEMLPTMSLKRVAAALQLLLATRRAARCEEHAYWYTVARGM